MPGGVRVAARALLLHRGHVLLLRAVEPGREFYFLPGGGVHHGETLAQACEREVREETGLSVRAVRPLFLREFIANRHARRAAQMPADQHVVAVIFECALNEHDAALAPQTLGRFQADRDAPGVTGLVWMPLADVAAVEIHPPHLKSALQAVLPHGLTFWPEE